MTVRPRSYLASITAPSEPGPEAGDLIGVIGDTLRSAREYVGLSRAEVVERLGSSIQTQTLATYEQGTRQCTVSRFVELCRAIGVSAPDLLSRALERARVDICSLTLRVDVAAIAVVENEGALDPLAHWAFNFLSMNGTATTVVRLTPVEVFQLGIFCGVSHEAMAARLLDFSPE